VLKQKKKDTKPRHIHPKPLKRAEERSKTEYMKKLPKRREIY
jgi:hypothetical protein